MMKQTTLIIFFTVVMIFISGITDASSKLQFNNKGKIIKPDFSHIRIGLKRSKEGKEKAALKHYLQAAKYGNYYAYNLIGSHHLEAGNLPEALAWLQLIDLEYSEQRDIITDLLDLLDQKLTPDETETAAQIHQELKQKYNKEISLKNRASWRNGLQFTGTKIRGKVPEYLTIAFELGEGGADQPQNSITSHEIKAQLDHYVNNYDFDIPIGEVKLNPIETIEKK